MNELFTVEEVNLMCIYGTRNRNALISELIEAATDFEDELFDIAVPLIQKLSKMSGAEYSALEFYPAYGDDQETEADT